MSKGKQASKKHQKIYKMKGCSKKTCKNHLGGSSADVNLAYTGKNIQTVPNPFLAYTVKGGANINASDKTIPNTGPPIITPATPFLNASSGQKGGCGCAINMTGGCGPLCASALLVGGAHRRGCKCSQCKMKGGNVGIPYPNGLVGTAWTPASNGWPGVQGSGSGNYLELNKYPTDVQTSIIATGANPPFSVGGKKKGTLKRSQKQNRKQKGGTLSNFLHQDLINVGRQFQFGLGTAYNALAGYSAPVSPLPWRGQIPNTASLSTIKAASI